MTWLSWALLVAGLFALFVLWDVIFCGGRRCRELMARIFELYPWRFRRNPRGE